MLYGVNTSYPKLEHLLDAGFLEWDINYIRMVVRYRSFKICVQLLQSFSKMRGKTIRAFPKRIF